MWKLTWTLAQIKQDKPKSTRRVFELVGNWCKQPVTGTCQIICSQLHVMKTFDQMDKQCIEEGRVHRIHDRWLWTLVWCDSDPTRSRKHQYLFYSFSIYKPGFFVVCYLLIVTHRHSHSHAAIMEQLRHLNLPHWQQLRDPFHFAMWPEESKPPTLIHSGSKWILVWFVTVQIHQTILRSKTRQQTVEVEVKTCKKKFFFR